MAKLISQSCIELQPAVNFSRKMEPFEEDLSTTGCLHSWFYKIYNPYVLSSILITVQLKGSLTHVDRPHPTYWPKAYGYINVYWHVQ